MPFKSIQDPAKLRRLLESVLLLEADLELPALLRHMVEESCSMTAARYGALGVLDESGSKLSEFITVGIDPKTESEIGARPTGMGVLGLIISDPRPLRLTNIATHPDSFGFPPHHPPMKSFLGVPVMTRERVYGNLYLTDKIGWSEFTEDDEALVSALAQAAGIAIENARLHEQVQRVAVFEDRDRIARDLHDAVIQRLFAVGLSLQGMVRQASAPEIAKRLRQAIDDIDTTIRQIRSSIFELSHPQEQTARSALVDTVRELDEVLGFAPEIEFEGAVDTLVSGEVLENLVFVLREALTNVAKHAEANGAKVLISVAEGLCSLIVVDNGRGFDTEEASTGGLGLSNLEARAKRMDGELLLDSSQSGTKLQFSVPLGL